MAVDEASGTVRGSGPVSPPPAQARRAGGLAALGVSVLRVRELAVLLVNIVLIIAFAVSSPGFFTSSNISNIATSRRPRPSSPRVRCSCWCAVTSTSRLG